MSLSPHTQEKKTEWKSLSKDMQEFVMRHALNQPEKLLSSQFKNMANAAFESNKKLLTVAMN